MNKLSTNIFTASKYNINSGNVYLSVEILKIGMPKIITVNETVS